MLPASVAEIERRLADSAVVLDVGGWGRPLTRADWVIDIGPYESRGVLGRDGSGPERFSADTWVEHDICDREPWPFEDGRFDFAVCSHTLEDVRDPLWVCSELNRVARAGYIEVPSRLEEQTPGVHGPWAGWSHHRWLVDVSGDRIEFAFKFHSLHWQRDALVPGELYWELPPERRVQTLWWEGSFDYAERVLMSAEEVDSYLADLARRELAGWTPPRRSLRRRARSALGRLRRLR